ncbi:MAG: hypothetical protein WDA12_01955, partial [Bacilli bacterium]
TSNATWLTYNGSFTIDSYNILSKGWQNEDKTVTIYAKGKDTAGNEITVTRKILNIDLDIPKTPVVTSNYGYPTLTSYGVTFDGSTKIEFDTRLDIDNYYSTDNGVTWLTYKGEFQSLEGTVKAKSVKRDTGLTSEVSKAIGMPTDALKPQAYDGDLDTFESTNGTRRVLIDSSLYNKKISIKTARNCGTASCVISVNIVSVDGTKITSYTLGNSTVLMDVPTNTKYLEFAMNNSKVYEVGPSNEPILNITNGYMLIHSDPTKSISKPYQLITINYFPTSVERLYKIGESGNWINYQDKPIWVNQGETIYAKGIDKYGNETRIISQHTVNVVNALGAAAYDGNLDTFESANGTKRVLIDSSLYNKKVSIKTSRDCGTASCVISVNIVSVDDVKITSYTLGNSTVLIDVPTNTKYLEFVMSRSKVYEIELIN